MNRRYGRGTENRYANDFSGNHIDRIRSEKGSPGFRMNALPGKSQTCATCKKRKPTKGGNRKSGRFICSDCVSEYKRAQFGAKSVADAAVSADSFIAKATGGNP